MKVIASWPHYADHLRPIAALLPDLDVTLVASYHDLVTARRSSSPIVLVQHGCGQSYSDNRPSYPGGDDNHGVGLFLTPNEHSAGRWRSAYPKARVEVVGSPRLDSLPRRQPGPPTVAISWHWEGMHTPEARSALAWYRGVLPELTRTFTVIGHGHPRRRDLDRLYSNLGIEYVRAFDEVCERADVYVCDNSSTLYEFAATGRPVVVLNAPWYRRDADHGLRFWEAAAVGVQVDDPADLVMAVARALDLRDDDVSAREAALDVVYTQREGAAQRAADAIVDWAA